MSVKAIDHNPLRQEGFYIKFYPSLKNSLGSEKAALILGRLEYWFSVPKFKEGFYKFVEPCSHPLYKEGDSWAEEVGFPRKIFAKAFDLIGVRYKSKSAFLQSKDKFQGKLYASYHDRKTNRTYFVRNHDFASDFLNGIFKRKPSQTTNIKNEKYDSSSSKNNGRSRRGKNDRSYGGTIGGKSFNSIQKNTPSLTRNQNQSKSAPSNEEKEKTEEMIKIWNEEVGEGRDQSLNRTRPEHLLKTLINEFENSILNWQNYCQTIASSKFLMGESQNKFFKKAWLAWAIKPETIEKIKSGAFTLGDRKTNQDLKRAEFTRSLEEKREEKERIERKLHEIQRSVEKRRTQKASEVAKTLDERKSGRFEKQFVDYLKKENQTMFSVFKESGFEEFYVRALFDWFVVREIETEIFQTSLEDETKHAIEESGLEETLREITENILEFEKDYALKFKRTMSVPIGM